VAVSVKPLHSKDETGREMRRLATTYAGDLSCFNAAGVPLDKVPLPVFFQSIANLPYRRDPGGVEIVSRPYLLLQSPTRGLDCKKKHIILAAWLERNGIPWRFAAVSRFPAPGPYGRPPIHHVIVQAFIDGEWVDLDATYPGNELFEIHNWTRVEPLSGSEPASDHPVLVSMSGDGDPTWQMYLEWCDQVQTVAPEYMGITGVEEGVSTAGIVAIVTAIVAAVASVTVAIISAASAARDRDKAAEVQAAQIQSYETLQAQAYAEATKVRQEADEQQLRLEKMVKQYVIPGSIALAAILFLGGK
jgi:hypothetical protein